VSARSRRARRKGRFEDSEDLNPMNYVSNLSDVMLILAVGIMLALILHWRVEIRTPEQEEQPAQAQENISFDNDDLKDMDELPENMERMGDVYYDPVSGKYYIIENKDQAD